MFGNTVLIIAGAIDGVLILVGLGMLIAALVSHIAQSRKRLTGFAIIADPPQ